MSKRARATIGAAAVDPMWPSTLRAFSRASGPGVRSNSSPRKRRAGARRFSSSVGHCNSRSLAFRASATLLRRRKAWASML